jgi:hypothetical protein
MGLVGHLWACMEPDHQRDLEQEFLTKLEAPTHMATMSTSLALMCATLQGWTLAVQSFRGRRYVKISTFVTLLVYTLTLIGVELSKPRQAKLHPMLMHYAINTVCRCVALVVAICNPSERRLAVALVRTTQNTIPTTRCITFQLPSTHEHRQDPRADTTQHMRSPFQVSDIDICEFFDGLAHAWATEKQKEVEKELNLVEQQQQQFQESWVDVPMMTLDTSTQVDPCGIFDGLQPL